jgi:hypothetical protein
MKNITPVIKRTRVTTSKYEVCPHCMNEIHEKEYFIDDENYIYHRACQNKGPIGMFHPMSKDEFREKFKSSPFFTGIKAQAQYIQTTGGTIDKNIAGVNYKIEWTAKANGKRINARAIKPTEMSDYMWYQIKEAMRAEAMKQAKELFVKNNMIRSASVKIDNQKPKRLNWLEKSAGTVGEEQDEQVTEEKESDDAETIDDGFLADGLGAFLDVFINYHSGPEGDKLAKWVIEVCQDPKYTDVADKLQKFHKLMGEIYEEVTDIAKNDKPTDEQER